ncbi:MAG: type I-C CRISPR-associated protein Cas8c/Csd1 [Anaerolineaceae bacterium]|nr:MAG: type I-C CRISPR-associated protein Cas8c/Csd1 [Anaerolineaceae bacterium]
MSVIRALYDSYNIALNANLVDRVDDIDQQTVLLPLYHSNRRSNGNDIIQITLTNNGEFIKADWVPKDEYIIFPVTESSIIRSSRPAPHPLCDELSYLSKEINNKKHELYIQEVGLWKGFTEGEQGNKTFYAISNYIMKETILYDVIKEIFGITEYNIDNKNVIHYFSKNQDKNEWEPEKIFITFLVENQDPLQKNLSVTTDQQLHNNYINYVRTINMNKPKKYCNISKELTYCVKSHRGIIGNSKLISVSNNNETYYGRFHSGEEVISIGYETSQKMHLILKFFLENINNSKRIGENSYLVNWFSDDISNSDGLQLTSSITTHDYDDLDLEADDDNVSLGGNSSKNLNDYLTGRERFVEPNSKFYVMIIDKISNGRVSIKYFRELNKSDLYQRVEEWYNSTRWGFYYSNQKKTIQQSPSIYTLVDYIMGMEIEENNKISIQCKNKKLRSKTIERLLPCIVDGKKFPMDLSKKMFYNLCKRNSYSKTWDSLVRVGCSIFKKSILDNNWKDEVSQMLDDNNKSQSFRYGQLLAIYEKLEVDALYTGSKDDVNRSTNAERLWAVYTKTPASTLMILETKVKPYKERLKKGKPSLYIYYERLIGLIMHELSEIANFENHKNNPLNEDFVFGYYAQKQDFYTKKPKVKEDEISENIKEEK